MTSETPWLSEQQQRVWRHWLQVTALLPAALHAQLQADSQLSFPDFEVLSELSEAAEQRLRVGDLAGALRWERSRLSHQVRRMEARGLLRREECAEDGRGAMVVLTPAGRSATERAAPGHAATVGRLLFEGLDRAELDQLEAILSRTADRLRDTVGGGSSTGRSQPGGGGRRREGGDCGPGPA